MMFRNSTDFVSTASKSVGIRPEKTLSLNWLWNAKHGHSQSLSLLLQSVVEKNWCRAGAGYCFRLRATFQSKKPKLKLKFCPLRAVCYPFQKYSTGGPRYSRSFYLRIRLFTLDKMVQNDNFLVKNGLFICEFKIRGLKWRNVSTANNEGNLYCFSLFLVQGTLGWLQDILEASLVSFY